MCVMSMIMEYLPKVPMDQWTIEKYDYLQDLLRRVEKLDKMLEQPDCVDPKKEEILKKIEERLASIEKKLVKLDASKPNLDMNPKVIFDPRISPLGGISCPTINIPNEIPHFYVGDNPTNADGTIFQTPLN